MGKPSVLLVSQYYPPDITAAAFRLGGMAERLAASGFEVTVFTTTPHKSIADDSLMEKSPGVAVIRVSVKARSHMGQYLRFVFCAMRRFRELSPKGKKPDVVIASSPPLSVILIGMIFSRRLRAQLILDVRDLWPDTPVALGRLPGSGPVFHLFKKLELRGYRRADAVLCVAGPMANRIREQGAASVSVVYNGVNRRDLKTAASWPVVSPPPPGKPWQVVYFGNLGLAQGLDVLLEAGEKLDPEQFNVHLMGAGARREEILQAIRSRGLNHFHLHAARSREAVMQIVAETAHILFFNLAPHPVFSRTIPSKLFDYLLLRRPTVAGIRGEGAEILSAAGSAVLFNGESPDALKRALNQAANDWEALTKRAVECNFKVVKGFLREDQYARVVRVIEEVTANRLSGGKPGRSI